MFQARLLCLSLVLLTSHLAQATDASGKTEDPRKAAKKYVQALRKKDYPGMAKLMHPEALAEFRSITLPLAEAADKKGKADSILDLFPGAKSLDDLKRMNPEEFFASFLQGTLKFLPETRQVLTNSKTEFLGHVAEGKDVAHVVYRMTAKVRTVSFTKMYVISLKKHKTEWRLILSGDIKGMAEALKLRLELN